MTYISEEHRLAWPYADSLSDFLGKNPAALAKWIEIGDDACAEWNKLSVTGPISEWNVKSRAIFAATYSARADWMKRYGISKEALAIVESVAKRFS